MPTLVNITAFNLLWLLIIAAAFNQMEGPAILVLAAWIGVHLYYSRYRRSDLRLLLVAVLVGPLIDTLLIQLALVQYAGSAPLPGYAPLWIIALWANFALLPNHSLRPMRTRPWLAAGAGALFAPLAYLGGESLGAARFVEPVWLPLLVLAGAWALLLPALMHLTAERHRAAAP